MKSWAVSRLCHSCDRGMYMCSLCPVNKPSRFSPMMIISTAVDWDHHAQAKSDHGQTMVPFNKTRPKTVFYHKINHEIPWSTMKYCGQPWTTILVHSFWRCFVKWHHGFDHGSSWSTMVGHDQPWSTLVNFVYCTCSFPCWPQISQFLYGICDEHGKVNPLCQSVCW